MNTFEIISTKFYNELRNGSTFSNNLSDYTTELVGNVGENLQMY